MNGNADNFGPFLKKSQKLKKVTKMENLLKASYLVYPFQVKMVNLQYHNFFQNIHKLTIMY